MEWVELFESLPISNVVILGLAYACWNIYKGYSNCYRQGIRN